MFQFFSCIILINIHYLFTNVYLKEDHFAVVEKLYALNIYFQPIEIFGHKYFKFRVNVYESVLFIELFYLFSFTIVNFIQSYTSDNQTVIYVCHVNYSTLLF